MVKLLLTVRRLANTWGVGGGGWTAWEEKKEVGERGMEGVVEDSISLC